MVEISPQGAADACVICLHGLGADANDFVPLIEALELPADHSIRFLFPDAPYRAVTLNGGMRMRAWYDISEICAGMREDEQGLRESQAQLVAMIERQLASGIPPQRIVLAGFSQGGCMALYAGLCYPQALAGILALSCYLPLQDAIARELAPCQRDTPVMLMHGRSDHVVDIGLGRQAYLQLRSLGLSPEWLEYPMEHAVCQEQLSDISDYLIKILGASGLNCE